MGNIIAFPVFMVSKMNPKLQEILKHCKDRETLKEVVTRVIPISTLMEVNTDKNLFCPFHDDEGGGKPSAKIYRNDNDGIEKLWCYSEGYMYTSYDYITLVMEDNPMKILVAQDSLPDIEQAVKEVNQKTTNYRQNQAKEIQDLGRKTPSLVKFFDLLYKV